MGDTARRPFYDEYAWAFDLLITPPLARQCDFIAETLSQRAVNSGARILDAGCGTGRQAVELARRGYNVTGLDMSAQLIVEAQKRINDPSLSISFIEGDILALASTPQYDGILCRGVLNDLLDETSRQEVFFSFARALRPGGALILDVREWEGTVNRKTSEPVFEKSVDTSRGKLTFRSRTRLDPQRRRLLVAERHTLLKDGVETVSTYDFKMQCWTQEELHRHLTEAGYESISYLGAYICSVLVGESDRLVCVATRRGS
jgi:ubiquinone/menaquinone biosynthesis C-methylase UbiE